MKHLKCSCENVGGGRWGKTLRKYRLGETKRAPVQAFEREAVIQTERLRNTSHHTRKLTSTEGRDIKT